MQDPHVVSLRYSAKSCEEFKFDNPPSIKFNHPLAEFSLNSGELLVTLSEHFSSTEDARYVIDPVIRAWEVQSALARNQPIISFNFIDANIIDRNPVPRTSGDIMDLSVRDVVRVTATLKCEVTCRSYPPPPEKFSMNPSVEIAYRRWIQSREGKEPLQSMAYFVLTLFEKSVNGHGRGRGDAATIYSIDLEILRKLGEITSTRGDAETARKAVGTTYTPLTGPEKHWVDAAVKVLIQRMGEHAAGASLQKIQMSDLPAM